MISGGFTLSPAFTLFILGAYQSGQAEFRSILIRTAVVGIPALVLVGAVLYLLWRTLGEERPGSPHLRTTSRKTKTVLVLLVVVLLGVCAFLAQMDFFRN